MLSFHRFTCNQYAAGNCLPVVRTMFHGHTLVECQADEGTIMRLMSETQENQGRMLEFLRKVERDCIPASLECVPENASAATQHSTVQATGLLTVDSQHWTPELPERIGLYHAYIRGFNRDVRTHRLFIVCSGGMNRASDMFCNLVIDVGRKCTAQVATRIDRETTGLFENSTEAGILLVHASAHERGRHNWANFFFIRGRTCATRRRPGGSERGASARGGCLSRVWPTHSKYRCRRSR